MLTENHPDALTLTLASLSWPYWQAGAGHLSAPWGLRVPEGRIAFYYWRSGPGCLVVPTHSHLMTLQPGDVAILPQGTPHSLRDIPERPDQSVERLWLDPSVGPTEVEPTNGSSVFVYGYLPVGELGFNPLEGKLPSLLQITTAMHGNGEHPHWDALVDLIDVEQHHRRPGWQAIVRQLVRVLFHQVLREHVLRNEIRNGQPRPVINEDLGSVEPSIQLVVGLLHAELGKPWTVTSLAKWIHMSRSAFSARFRDVVGQPPLQYLTEVRMQRACELLASSDLGIKQIAIAVGYESPSSFTNAFKRWRGVSPMTYRANALAKVVEA